MIWARMLAYITGTVDQELLLRNEYWAAENRILRAQIKGRLLLSDAEKATLAETRRWAIFSAGMTFHRLPSGSKQRVGKTLSELTWRFWQQPTSSRWKCLCG